VTKTVTKTVTKKSRAQTLLVFDQEGSEKDGEREGNMDEERDTPAGGTALGGAYHDEFGYIDSLLKSFLNWRTENVSHANGRRLWVAMSFAAMLTTVTGNKQHAQCRPFSTEYLAF